MFFSAQNTESEDTSAASDDDMAVVMSKKKARLETRRKRVESPPNPPPISYLAAAETGLHLLNRAPPAPVIRAKQPGRQLRSNLIIGSSADPCAMTAAHTLTLPKGIYRIANVGGGATVESVAAFVKNLGVHVLSVYDRTPKVPRIAGNKSFRVCIVNSDRHKLLLEENWGAGITIQHWDFGPKKKPGGGPGTVQGAGRPPTTPSQILHQSSQRGGKRVGRPRLQLRQQKK